MPSKQYQQVKCFVLSCELKKKNKNNLGKNEALGMKSLGAEEQGKGALRVQRVRGELDWLHNLWGPVQNDNEEPLGQRSRISV